MAQHSDSEMPSVLWIILRPSNSKKPIRKSVTREGRPKVSESLQIHLPCGLLPLSDRWSSRTSRGNPRRMAGVSVGLQGCAKTFRFRHTSAARMAPTVPKPEVFGTPKACRKPVRENLGPDRGRLRRGNDGKHANRKPPEVQ